jgi:glycosyltransferase involved in cell wall biosynthesis
MKLKKGCQVIMLGPSFKTQGGISSVLKIYKENFAMKDSLTFIETYSGKNRLKDFLYFGTSIIKTFFVCIRNKDIIAHIHTASNGSYFRKSILANIFHLFGKKVIFHIHGAEFDLFIEKSSEARKKDIINTLNKCERVIVLSQTWKNYFAKYVDQKRIEVLYNPAVTGKTALQPRVKAKNGNEKVVIIFLGRLGQRKGAYDLVNAVEKIRDENFLLYMYGDGEIKEISDIVQKKNLGDKIMIKGWLSHDRVDEVYKDSDILVLPSYAEGLPMSILEAISYGLPIVSTNVGGISEAVQEGKNGYLIIPGDVEALANRLKCLINEYELRVSMSKKSLEIAWEKFSVDTLEKKLINIYNSIL